MKEKKKEIKKRNGYQLQYYCLGNPKDRGAWQGQRSLAGCFLWCQQKVGYQATNTFTFLLTSL